MPDFDAKLNRRRRNDWRGQEIEVEVFEEGTRVMRIAIGRHDGYRQDDPSEYEVKVINATDQEHVEVSLMHLHSGEVLVATK